MKSKFQGIAAPSGSGTFRVFVCLLLMFLFAFSSVQAQCTYANGTYYVSASGNDGTGTVNDPALPYATLSGAIAAAEAAGGNAIISLQDATYTDNSIGVSVAPAAVTGNCINIDGNGAVITSTAASVGFISIGGTNNTLQNMTLTGFNWPVGAVFIDGTDFLVDNVSAIANESANFMEVTGTGTISNSLFHQNEEGALEILGSGAVVNVVNTDFTCNSRDTAGGAVEIAGGADVTFDGGTFAGNYVSSAGGGLYVHGDATSVTLNGTNFVQNISNQTAGAIYILDSEFDINGGVYTLNSATGSYEGGAILIEGGSASNSTGTIDDVLFYQNGSDTTLPIVGPPNAQGGGGGTGMLPGGGDGGAMYIGNFANVTIGNSLFVGNMADHGSAIVTKGNDDRNVVINNSTFTGNISGSSDGAVHASSYLSSGVVAPVLINNSILWGNSDFDVEDAGGSDGSQITIQNSTYGTQSGAIDGGGNSTTDPGFDSSCNSNTSLTAGSEFPDSFGMIAATDCTPAVDLEAALGECRVSTCTDCFSDNCNAVLTTVDIWNTVSDPATYDAEATFAQDCNVIAAPSADETVCYEFEVATGNGAAGNEIATSVPFTFTVDAVYSTMGTCDGPTATHSITTENIDGVTCDVVTPFSTNGNGVYNITAPGTYTYCVQIVDANTNLDCTIDQVCPALMPFCFAPDLTVVPAGANICPAGLNAPTDYELTTAVVTDATVYPAGVNTTTAYLDTDAMTALGTTLVAPTATSTYYIEVTSDNGTADTADDCSDIIPFTVTVDDIPPTITCPDSYTLAECLAVPGPAADLAALNDSVMQVCAAADIDFGNTTLFPFAAGDLANASSGNMMTGPFPFDIFDETTGSTTAAGGVDDLNVSFQIIDTFDPYGGTIGDASIGTTQDVQQSTGTQNTNSNGLIGTTPMDNVATTNKETTTGDVRGYCIEIDFASHLKIEAGDLTLLLNSVNTAGEAFESSSVVFNDINDVPFGSATYAGYYSTPPTGTAGGSPSYVVNSSAWTTSGTGVYLAQDPTVVDITDIVEPVAGANVASDNFDPNAATDGGLDPSTPVGGFTFCVYLEDVAATASDGLFTTTQTLFESALNGITISNVCFNSAACDNGPLNSLAITSVDDPLPGAIVPADGGTITRTYTATDACGNTATCEQTITVPPCPVLCPDIIDGSLNASVAAAPAADVCSGTAIDVCVDVDLTNDATAIVEFSNDGGVSWNAGVLDVAADPDTYCFTFNETNTTSCDPLTISYQARFQAASFADNTCDVDLQTMDATPATVSVDVYPNPADVVNSVLSDDGACGPSITQDCGTYTVTNDFDANGANPDFSSTTTDGPITFTITNSAAPTACQTTTVVSSYVCATCLSPVPSTADAPAVCAGGSFDLATVTVVDAEAGNYPAAATVTTTYHSASPADGTNVLAATSVTPSATTTYYILLTNDNETAGDTSDDCSAEIPVTITVNALPVLAAIPATSVCADATPVTLADYNPLQTSGIAGGSYVWYNDLAGAPDIAGGAITTAAVDGTYWVVYTEPAPTSCETQTSMALTIDALPTPVDAPISICASETATDLTTNDATVLDGETGTVTWYDGDPGAAGVALSPATAVDLNSVADLWAQVTLAGTNCQANVDITTTITAAETATFDPVGPICSGDALTLPTSSTNATAITGTWSPAVDNTATTLYTFTPDAGQCALGTTLTVVVNQPTLATFDPIGPICSGDALVLPGTSLNAITGSWTPAIDNTTTTLYTFTPDAGQCATGTTLTVVVDQPELPLFNPIGPICSGDALVLPGTSLNAITGTWTPAVDNTTSTLYTFTPDAGQCAQNATLQVDVDQPMVPTFGSLGPYCVGASADALPGFSNEGISGTWDAAISTAAEGTTVYNFTPDAGECASAGSLSVTVTTCITCPSVSVSPTQVETELCDGDSPGFTAATVDPAGSSDVSYLWTAPDGTTSSNPTPTFTLVNDGCAPISVIVSYEIRCISENSLIDAGSFPYTVYPSDITPFYTIEDGSCDGPIVTIADGCASNIAVTAQAGSPTFPLSATASGTVTYDVVYTPATACIPNATDTGNYDCNLDAPSVLIDKDDNDDTDDNQTVSPGADASFTITVTNNGNVALTNVVITDDQANSSACEMTAAMTAAEYAGGATVDFDPGEFFAYTCSTTGGVSAAFINTASVTADPVGGGTSVNSSDPTTIAVQGTAGIAIDKHAPDLSDTQTVDSGNSASFEIVVTNTGDVDLINVFVDDPLEAACDQFIGNLAAGGSFTYTCTGASLSASYTNIAEVSGEPAGGGPEVTATDPSEVVVNPAPIPGITIDKHAIDLSDSQTVNPGASASFEIVVTNSGDVDLFNVFVDDPLESACDQFVGSLAAGDSFTYTCTGAAVTTGYTNVADVSGDPVDGSPQVTASDPSDVLVSGPSIVIVKDDADNTDDTQTIAPNGDATFTITVTNDGDVDLENVVVSDPLAPNCDLLIGNLAAGATHPAYTCTVSNVAENFTNIAEVSGTPVGGGNAVTDEDPSDVVISGTAAITVDKHALDLSDSQTVNTGTAAIFEIVVTNTGDIDLSNVFVDDPSEANCDQLIGTLAAGANFTYTCTGDPVTASYTNMATVTGDPDDGSPQVSDTDPSDVVVNAPSITIVKDDADNSDDTQNVALNGTATFTITVTNNGAVDLEDVTVTDPLAPGCDLVIGNLAAGATHPPYTCTLENISADLTNIANVSGNPVGGGAAVSASDPSDVVVDLLSSVSIDKHALDQSDSQEINSGTAPTFEIVVTNTGQVALNNVSVNDPQEPACDETIGSLAPGQVYTYTCTGAAVTSSYTNVADVTGDPADGSPQVTATDPSEVVVDTPSILIDKDDADNGDDMQSVSPGGTATFTITVTNNGTVDLENVTVTDALAPGCDLVIGNLAAGATHPAYTCSIANVDANFTNSASVTGSPVGGGAAVSDEDTSEVLVEGTASVTVDKHALDGSDEQAVLEGSAPSFEIVVTNNGDVDLTNVIVTDAMESACDITIGDLGAGQSFTYTCTGAAVTQGYTNIAEVTGDPENGDPSVSATDPSEVTVDSPSVVVDKNDADNGDDMQTVDAGGTASFTITVTNDGNVDLQNVVVSDPSAPECDQVIGNLAVGDDFSYTCSVSNVMGDFTNVANVSAEPVGGGDPVTDEDTSEVEVDGNPSISIMKSATDGTDSQTVNPGTNATFDIVVTNNGDVDLENVFVTDFMAQQCDRNIGTLAAGEMVFYTCIDIDVDGTYVNTAVVVGDPVNGDPSVYAEDPSDVYVPQPSIQIIKDDTDNNDDIQVIQPGGTANFSITVTNNGELDLQNVTVSDPLSPGCDLSIGSLAIGESYTTYTCSLANVENSFTNIAQVTASPVGGGDTVFDDDPTSVVVIGSAAITVDKHAPSGSDYQTVNPGSPATFEITVTNSGDVDLSNVEVTDPLVPECDMMIGDLAIGESFTYTCEDPSVDEGYVNIAEVTGEPNNGGLVIADTDPSSVDTTNPSIVIIKEDADNTDDMQIVSPGGTATFTVTVVNNGNIDLENVAVSDPMSPNCDMTIGSLGIGESMSYTCSIDNVEESFTNLATVTASPVGGGNPISDDDPSEVMVVGLSSVSVDKHAADGSDLQVINPGQDASFEITVTNTGEVDLENVVVNDAQLPACNTEIAFLGVGESVTYTCVDSNVQSGYVNLVTVTADPTNGDPSVTDEDDSEVDLNNPALLVVKENVDGSDVQVIEPGGTATFSISIVNKGNVALVNVIVEDNATPSCNTVIPYLEVGETHQYTCTAENVNTSFVNIALVSAEPDGGGSPIGASDGTEILVSGTPSVTISKTAFDGSDSQLLSAGEEAVFNITITNTGDVDLQNVSVQDPLASGCDQFVGDLEIGESFSYLCSDPEVAASYTNVATVSADPVDGSPSISADDSTEIEVLDCSNFAVSLEEACQDDSDQFYSLVIAFNGGNPGSGGYTLVDNISGEIQTGLEGSTTYGVFTSGTGYDVTVSVTNNPACFYDFSKELFECEGFLAVEFLGLRGTSLEQGNELTWSTASEVNSEAFKVYRSNDGVDFSLIATVATAGNSNTVRAYDYLDEQVPAGISYYKVVATSLDGLVQESNVIYLDRGANMNFEVFPIPTDNELILNLTSQLETTFSITIQDLLGRIVDTKKIDASIGLNELLWDVSALPAGVYFVNYHDGQTDRSMRFVKK